MHHYTDNQLKIQSKIQPTRVMTEGCLESGSLAYVTLQRCHGFRCAAAVPRVRIKFAACERLFLLQAAYYLLFQLFYCFLFSLRRLPACRWCFTFSAFSLSVARLFVRHSITSAIVCPERYYFMNLSGGPFSGAYKLTLIAWQGS